MLLNALSQSQRASMQLNSMLCLTNMNLKPKYSCFYVVDRTFTVQQIKFFVGWLELI